MAVVTKTEAEKIFTNLMGTGAARLAADNKGANFHGVFEYSTELALQNQRMGSQLLFLTALYPNASDGTVRAAVLSRIHRILQKYTFTFRKEIKEDPSGMLGPLGIYSAYALAEGGKFDYTQAGGIAITRANLNSVLTGYMDIEGPKFTINHSSAAHFKNPESYHWVVNMPSATQYFAGTKHARVGLNGFISCLGTFLFIEGAMRGRTANYIEAELIANKLTTALQSYFGNTRVNPETGLTELSLPIGAGRKIDGNGSEVNQIRGYFPSSGYNSLIVMGLSFAARAKVMAHGTKPQVRSVQPSGTFKELADKITNYYDYRVQKDGQAYELGKPLFAGGSAGISPHSTEWMAQAKKWYDEGDTSGSISSYEEGNYLALAQQDIDDRSAVTAYLYSTAFNGSHNLVQNTIGTALKGLEQTSASPLYHYCAVSNAKKAEAGASRILQGLAGAMFTNQSSIN